MVVIVVDVSLMSSRCVELQGVTLKQETGILMRGLAAG